MPLWPLLMARKSGAQTTEMIAISFMTMLRAGPEVSLRGSPTVSPTTADLKIWDFFVFTLPLLFEALTNSRPTGYNKHGKCVRKLTARERAAKLKEEKKREQKKMSQRLSEK